MKDFKIVCLYFRVGFLQVCGECMLTVKLKHCCLPFCVIVIVVVF